jgi:RNAse (barnase) inhibitor barstar
MAFIAADFPESKFTKKFYNRLSQTFGMIAHYVECVIMRSTNVNAAWIQR